VAIALSVFEVGSKIGRELSKSSGNL